MRHHPWCGGKILPTFSLRRLPAAKACFEPPFFARSSAVLSSVMQKVKSKKNGKRQKTNSATSFVDVIEFAGAPGSRTRDLDWILSACSRAGWLSSVVRLNNSRLAYVGTSIVYKWVCLIFCFAAKEEKTMHASKMDAGIVRSTGDSNPAGPRAPRYLSLL